ncbi:hypothetical protein MAR_024147 [Mya arenaria]|uniref:Uncharacterized protein n=1 Tax=Mya arenaria TaxID=6604 RepID=A0ABY7DQT7_MYAAR|nr:hypothetical protein MAR_024147 [Mya arenaria]
MTGMKDSNPWKVLMAAYSVNADAGTSTFMLTSVQHCVTGLPNNWLDHKRFKFGSPAGYLMEWIHVAVGYRPDKRSCQKGSSLSTQIISTRASSQPTFSQ